MNACVLRVFLAGLCAIGACVMAIVALVLWGQGAALGYFVGLAYVGAWIAPNAEDAQALFRGFSAKGE